MTYASGLQAVTIVWVSRCFTDEHRSALDWLNEITDDSFRFFGLEIEVWKIGDSGAAPKFNIVSKPNDWHRQVTKGAAQLDRSELSETRKAQLDFWTAFKALVDEQGALFKSVKPQPQHWLSLGIGRSGFRLSPIASFWDSVRNSGESHEIRVELSLESINAKTHYEALESRRDEIETGLNRELIWHNPQNARACRVYVRKGVDLSDRASWPEYLDWLVSGLNQFYSYFQPLVRDLEP